MRFPAISFILAVVLWSTPVHSHDVRVPNTIGELPLEQVSPGNYLVHAPLNYPTRRMKDLLRIPASLSPMAELWL